MDVTNVPERPKPSAKPAKQPAKNPKQKTETKEDLTVIQDPNIMFKAGFLAEVYKERPISDQVPRILTRMPPEPNVSRTCQMTLLAHLEIDCC